MGANKGDIAAAGYNGQDVGLVLLRQQAATQTVAHVDSVSVQCECGVCIQNQQGALLPAATVLRHSVARYVVQLPLA
jgi:hypothetical protein